jgi:hypothetical protein
MRLPVTTYYAIILVLHPDLSRDYSFNIAQYLADKYYFGWWQNP